MVEARAGLHVRGPGVLRIGKADPERRAPTDVVDELLRARLDGVEPEERHQAVIEGDALGDPVHPEDQVGDAVDLDSLLGAHRGRLEVVA